MGEGGAQVALLAALGVVVDPVGRDPLQRVADHVEELRVGDHRVHALGHPEVLGVGGVVGRGLAADLRPGVEVGAGTSPRPAGQFRSSMKKLSSLGLDIQISGWRLSW